MSLDVSAAVTRTARPRKFALVAAGMAALMAFASPAAAKVQAPSPEPAANPDLAGSCGLDFALILDRSTSVQDNDASSTVRNAAKSFLDALADTGSTVSLVSFSTTATVDVPPTALTSGDNLEHLHKAVDSMEFKGYTNWDDALMKAESQFEGYSATPPLVIMVTDGVPNRWINDHNSAVEGSGGEFSQVALDHAVVQANAVKSTGAHMFAIGVEGQDGLNESALQAISGQDEWTNGDLAQADWTKVKGFDQLSGALQGLATELCGGTVTVEKYLDGEPAAGWTFNATGAVPDSGVTGDDGLVNFEWDSVQPVDTVITEQPQAGVALTGAVCTQGGQEVGSFTDEAMHLTVGPEDIITCRFANRTVETGTPPVDEPTDPPVEPADPPVEPTDPPVEPADPPAAEKPAPAPAPEPQNPTEVKALEIDDHSGPTLPRTGVTPLPLAGLGVGLLGLGQALRAARSRASRES